MVLLIRVKLKCSREGCGVSLTTDLIIEDTSVLTIRGINLARETGSRAIPRSIRVSRYFRNINLTFSFSSKASKRGPIS